MAATATVGCSHVFLPTGPWSMPERKRSAGEFNAPPLTTIARGSTRTVRPVCSCVPGWSTSATTACARLPVHSMRRARQSAWTVAPLQDRDGEVGCRPVAAVLVEARIGGRLLHVELGLGVVAAFLEDDDGRARGSQPGGHHRSAGAAPDDADVGAQDEVLLEVGAGDDAASHLSAPGPRSPSARDRRAAQD